MQCEAKSIAKLDAIAFETRFFSTMKMSPNLARAHCQKTSIDIAICFQKVFRNFVRIFLVDIDLAI